jgi:serine/threonine protein kinase
VKKGRSALRVIDFGSGCDEDKRMFTYIQSRFYRAPEVILGMAYGRPIDMWSFGCILAELYTGLPLFPGESEHQQLQCIMEICSVPEPYLLEQASRRLTFFGEDGSPILKVDSKGRLRKPGGKTLAQALRTTDEGFLSFLGACLQLDPKKRMRPSEGMLHPWVTDGITQLATSGSSAVAGWKVPPLATAEEDTPKPCSSAQVPPAPKPVEPDPDEASPPVDPRQLATARHTANSGVDMTSFSAMKKGAGSADTTSGEQDTPGPSDSTSPSVRPVVAVRSGITIKLQHPPLVDDPANDKTQVAPLRPEPPTAAVVDAASPLRFGRGRIHHVSAAAASSGAEASPEALSPPGKAQEALPLSSDPGSEPYQGFVSSGASIRTYHTRRENSDSSSIATHAASAKSSSQSIRLPPGVRAANPTPQADLSQTDDDLSSMGAVSETTAARSVTRPKGRPAPEASSVRSASNGRSARFKEIAQESSSRPPLEKSASGGSSGGVANAALMHRRARVRASSPTNSSDVTSDVPVRPPIAANLTPKAD